MTASPMLIGLQTKSLQQLEVGFFSPLQLYNVLMLHLEIQFKPINKSTTAVFLMLLCLSCGNGKQSQPTNSPPVEVLSPSQIREREGFDDIHKSVAVTDNNTTEIDDGYIQRFRFADHLERAHFRSSGLLIDFGTAARDKYTLAEWMSGIKGNFNRDGLTYSYVTGNNGVIYFHAPEEEQGGGTIAFRLKAEGSKKAKIFLNKNFVGEIQAGSEFDHAQVSFQKGILAGLNEIKIQGGSKARTKEGIAASLALDYVRIIPENTGDGPASASFDTAKAINEKTGKTALNLSAGESLTYYLPIPEGTLIRGRVKPERDGAKAALSVVALTDVTGEAASIKVNVNNDSSFELNLSSLAGDAAAVTFSAQEGGVFIDESGLYEKSEIETKAPGQIKAKNIVLVLIDTLRSDKLLPYNPDTRVKTDYLSGLEREAMVFKRAFAPENWTKPSIASLLTGLYPDTHNTREDRDALPSSATMISEHLKSLGFVTAGFVANGYISGKFGFQRGWDTWTNYVREGKPNRAQFVIADAVKWLDKRNDNKPFFLYIHTIDPHVPYIPPQKYIKMYDAAPYNGQVEASATAKIAEGIKTGRVKLGDRDKIRFEALYDGEISYHDDELAALQNKLGELNLLEDTAIIITSDHGEEFFEHGSVGHGHSLYEELLHVPLFIRLPGKHSDEQPSSDTDEVSLTDVFPTICDLLGVAPPKDLEGKSLVKRLKKEARDDFPSAAAANFLQNQKAIRMGRYKLIYRGARTTLFDLKNDPKETRDLSDESPIALVTLRDQLGIHLSRFASTSGTDESKGAGKKQHTPVKAVIDKETEAQLKALGYLGGE